MNVTDFINKWRRAELTERQAAQQHFLDLCEVLEHPKPADADPTGESFCFERGAAKHGGSAGILPAQGWADVWKRGFFGWEYKGRHKDLNAAYDQLLQYREALENPPLLVVCDMDRIVVHTNFTATASRVHDIPLAELGAPRNLEILRSVFHDPEKLKPGVTSEAVTTEAASRLADIAQALRGRGLDAHEVAHFLDRLVFCMFAEDIGLLPKGLFTRVVDNARHDPERFTRQLTVLFAATAHGGDFGAEVIPHFNGNLFVEGPVLELTVEEIESVRRATALDWSAVDPSIFGTLFERGMDPAKRAQLGAHYTSREDIERLVEPLVMQPLRREWDQLRETVECLLTTGRKSRSVAGTGAANRRSRMADRKSRMEADVLLHRFLTRLANVKVLDPACGSGNFLYVTLQKLKDLEKAVIVYAMEQGFSGYLPLVGPWQLYGIEISPYAYDLAQMTVWIGYLQWTRANGFGVTEDPILRPSNNFQCMDAILHLQQPAVPEGPSRDELSRDRVPFGRGAVAQPPISVQPAQPLADARGSTDPGTASGSDVGPHDPEWPRVDFIISNPPFLGGKKMRAELGDEYVESLFALYRGRVRPEADLCCYWFEKARKHIEDGKCKRAGLLATQGIRGGANREVLKRIKDTGDIFFAESDRPWVLDGANVHVSMIGFDNGTEQQRVLDGKPVATVNSNLTALADITTARRLSVNLNLAFMGDTKGGAFDIPEELALELLQTPNPHGRPNSDVVVPWVNGLDITRRPRGMWIVDFGAERNEGEAARYEAPFENVRRTVWLERQKNSREAYRLNWWRHVEARPGMRAACSPLPRFLGTPNLTKHRVFVWLTVPTVPDHQLIVFARSDDYFFGVLHSRLHEVWARAQGTQLRERESGFRYTPTTCFETFPFPEEGLSRDREGAVAEAARELNELRERWLNPPEWMKEEVLEFPGSVDGPWARYVHIHETHGIGTVRYRRLAPRDGHCAKRLVTRTLTNLYNQRPAWLDLAHRKLDETVFAAYGWPPDLTDEEILQNLLQLNLERNSSRRR